MRGSSSVQVRTDQLAGEADYEKDGLPRAFDCNLTRRRICLGAATRNSRARTGRVTGLRRCCSWASCRSGRWRCRRGAHAGPAAVRPATPTCARPSANRAARTALAAAQRTLAEAEKTKPPPRSTKPAEAKVLLRDDFAAPKPEAWEVGDGPVEA